MTRELALDHLALRLRPLLRALRAAVERQAGRAERVARPDLVPLCITQDEAIVLLDEAEGLFADRPSPSCPMLLTPEEAVAEAALRAQAAAVGDLLPLDALARAGRLSAFEQDALLACVAPEIDRCHERLYGYVLDDMTRRYACAELIDLLTHATPAERLAHRHLLGPRGALQRTGMLMPWGDAATALRQELRAGDGLLECMCGVLPGWTFRDPAEVDDRAPAPDSRRPQAERLGRALACGAIGVVGLWGPTRAGHADWALALARAAGRPLRRYRHQAGDITTAVALDALLWVEVDALTDEAKAKLAEALAAAPVAAVLTGIVAWRPTTLLGRRAYLESDIEVPAFDERLRLWARAWPEATADELDGVAQTFRLGPAEVRAAARVARTAADERTDGLAPQVRAACAAVISSTTRQHIRRIQPRRGPADLVLAPALHAQVLEIATFHRAGPKVAEHWGFGRLVSGAAGLRVLFTGDSGTGKTLAAEVVAGLLDMPLLKVDLSQVVSKWVGETEKHLGAMFEEAEDGHGVLFFDEADALFGKRGDVRHGVDRYANLEVSYLLQRIEDHGGLVILASNLKDNIDAAFTRRFQVALTFPRPGLSERRRLWKVAFPPAAPLQDGLDLDVLARLDLTGAGITGAARTAALIAVAEGAEAIDRRHVVQAIARQYQREARVLAPAELGPYAALAREYP